MSAVVAVVGQVRTVREMRKKTASGQGPGEVWGARVGVLTEVGGVLGETLNVTVFTRELSALNPQPGDDVQWVADVTAGKYGLDAVFKAELAAIAA